MDGARDYLVKPVGSMSKELAWLTLLLRRSSRHSFVGNDEACSRNEGEGCATGSGWYVGPVDRFQGLEGGFNERVDREALSAQEHGRTVGALVQASEGRFDGSSWHDDLPVQPGMIRDISIQRQV